jgi:uncharacterized DUF497 family protein
MVPSSSGLGYRPLTAKTGVRFPLGLPKQNFRVSFSSLPFFIVFQSPLKVPLRDIPCCNDLDMCIHYMYISDMKIVWDPAKAKSNFEKHKIRFSDAESVLFDPMALTREDEGLHDEQRFVTIGRDAFDRITIVVYTYRGKDIRLVSATRATPHERQTYEEGI